MPAPQRLGFLGGSFDPPHFGHFQIARDMREQLELDRVYFIPAAGSPLKSKVPSASGEDRISMLQAGIKGQNEFGVIDWELTQPPPSYTINTVSHLRESSPGAEIFWLIGADQVAQLDRWHRITELVQLAHLVAIHRPGHSAAPPPIKGLSLHHLRPRDIKISSSMIRECILAGKPIDNFVPNAVLEIIANKGLYQYSN